jgi:hypothetical protein
MHQRPDPFRCVHGHAFEKGLASVLRTNQATAVLRGYTSASVKFPVNIALKLYQKRIKRKEYYTMTDFADDVELVFSNAMAFNQDHTQIWEDALNLRVRNNLFIYFSVPQLILHRILSVS